MENNRIKELRLAKGMTLLQIAKLMEVSEGTVQRWETGNIHSMRQGRLSHLAEILDTTPAYMLGWDTPTNETEMSSIFPKLTLENQSIILTMAKALLKQQ